MKAYFRDLVLAVAETLKIKPPEVAPIFSSFSGLLVDKNGETISFAQSSQPEPNPVVQLDSFSEIEGALCINTTYRPVPMIANTSTASNEVQGCFQGKGGVSIGIQSVGKVGVSMCLSREAGCEQYIDGSRTIPQPQ